MFRVLWRAKFNFLCEDPNLTIFTITPPPYFPALDTTLSARHHPLKGEHSMSVAHWSQWLLLALLILAGLLEPDVEDP